MKKQGIFLVILQKLNEKGEYMTYICSVGLGIPNHEITQNNVKKLVQEIFPYSEREIMRLLPVFDHAAIHKRQLVVDAKWFKEEHTFEEKNHLYKKFSQLHALEAIDDCLTNKTFLKEDLPYEAIDMIVFVSSTGISTPSLEAYLMNDRPFREDVIRMPLWGLGCAGGAIGLSRASDWLIAHPSKNALVICCELCSLTFQKNDTKKSNLIGTALFGDGVSSILMMGKDSPYLSSRKKVLPKIVKTSSFTKKNSTDVMGWDVTSDGLEVIFSKSIPKLVQTLWKDHILTFFKESAVKEEQIHSFIAHPGGKKVLEAMEDAVSIQREKLAHSYNVLANHGNMSSATVFYVLNEWLKENVAQKQLSILSALGPGFSSEILLLEWD